MATEPLYRNAFMIMLASVIGSGLGFFFWIAAGRLYDVNDVGYAVALFQTITFLAGLAHLGLGTATLRYLPESADKPALVNSAATLVGLMFVTASIGANVFKEENSAALRAFISPTVVHFVTVLFVCFACMIPTRTWSACSPSRRSRSSATASRCPRPRARSRGSTPTTSTSAPISAPAR